MPEGWQQAHVDIGALAQRVTGLEAGMQQIQGAIGDLSKKLDAKPTNWVGLISVLAAVLTVIGGAIAMLMSPINGDLSRHEREIARLGETLVGREEYKQHHEELARWLENLRDRVRADEDLAVTRREFDALAKRVDDENAVRSRGDAELSARLAKEIEELARRDDERTTTVANGLHELQHDFYASHQAVVPPK